MGGWVRNPAEGLRTSSCPSCAVSNFRKCSAPVSCGGNFSVFEPSASSCSSSNSDGLLPLRSRWLSSAQCCSSGRFVSEQLACSAADLKTDFVVNELSSHLIWAANSRLGPEKLRRRSCRAQANSSNDGRVRGSGVGYPPGERFSVQLPPLTGLSGVSVLPVGSGNTLVETSKPRRRSKESLSTLVEPIADDLRILNDDLHKIVGAENPLLMAAAEQIFSAGGKRLRPALVFLVSKATAQLAGLEAMRPQHWRLAQVIEMIHTASLIHDDVLDESDTRRGKDTIHTVFGTRVAVLAGDFMFAQSSWYLANLDNLEVIKLISQVIKDFASGEIKQAMSLFDCDISLQDYLDKSYYKTASLIAASTRSAAIFSGMSKSVCDQMYDYGLHLGLAFQVVDDILDFTESSEHLGKPAGSDLAKGNLTAPVLFALQIEPELRELISSEFSDEGSLDAAIALVSRSGGIEKARQLAQEKGNLALMNLDCLPQSPLRHSLEGIVDYVLHRMF